VGKEPLPLQRLPPGHLLPAEISENDALHINVVVVVVVVVVVGWGGGGGNGTDINMNISE
jgi:hypothetical protein